MSNQAPHEGTISAETAARLLMISDRRLRQLVDAGWIARARHGRYELPSVVQGYLRFRHDVSERAESREAGDLELRRARAREIEQRIAVRDAGLIVIEEHNVVAEEAFGILALELNGLPPTAPRQVRKRVRQEVEDILNRALTRFDRATAELIASGRAPAVNGEDSP